MTKSDAAVIIEDLLERQTFFDEQEEALEIAIESLKGENNNE